MRLSVRPSFPFSRIFRLAAAGALALLFSACQTREMLGQDGKGGIAGVKGHEYNTLAVALASVPANYVDAQYVAGLSTPVAMEFAPDGRLFVCEKAGALRIVKNGALLGTPFKTVSVDGQGERGLLGVAFDPNFAAEPFVYVYYTVPGNPAHNRVSRFRANASNPDVGDAEQILFELSNLGTAVIHNGGAIHFGTDGKLYIATGENSVPANARDLNSQLGKVLRINKDGSIPTDNPFYNSTSGNNRAIWARGFRNPFTFAVHSGTGRLFVSDVGQDTYEEVDDVIKGGDYGWNITEGPHSTPGIEQPFHYYRNELVGGVDHCSIIGAAFYTPTTFNFPADYANDFFFGDWCGGYINSLDLTTKAVRQVAWGIGSGVLVDLKVGKDGALYYLQIQGQVRKITYTGAQPPVITSHPAGKTVGVGQPVTFSVVASGSPAPTYQWQRNQVNIAGATSESYAFNAGSGDGGAKYRVVVSNSGGVVNSNEATLTLNGNRAPVPTINTPAAGATYTGGTTINFSGSATDPDEASVPASAFTWKVDFHHASHSHPVMASTPGSTSGSFNAPNSGEISDTVWYRVTLTVTDASGWPVTVTRDIQPIKTTITLATNPAGLKLTLDGAQVSTPFTFTGVVGMQRTIGAVSPQSSGGTNYGFTSWSDGGAVSHLIATPAGNPTLTASFAASAWTSKDIGSVGVAGSHSISGSTHTLKGSGADIWDVADGFRIAYQALSGDGQITARILSVPNTDPWAKAGVMVRESEAANSRHALMAQTFGNAGAFQRREATGGTSLHTAAAGTVTPLWVRITRTGNSLKGFHSTNGTAWTQVGESVQANLPATLLYGLAVTSHNNAVLGTSTFDNVSIVAIQPPPPTWTAQDIGAVGLAGSTTGTGTLTVKGAGADIYNAADAFHFYHRSLNADGEIRARILSMGNTNQWAKAGVMIRENTAVGSRHVYMGTTPASGLEFLRREAANGATTPVGIAGGAPRWVRITRVGNVFTTYQSTDGSAWTQTGAVTLALAADVRVGLAVCSHDVNVLNTATFDNVSVTD